MKKIYLSLLVLVGLFTLAACGGKKEVKVTYQEANQMLESVNTEDMLEDVFTLNGNFKVDLATTSKIGDLETSESVKGSGSVELYIKATKYEEFYVIGKLNFDLTTTSNERTSEMKLNGNLYIVEGNLYLDGTLKSKTVTDGATQEQNTTVKMKQSDMFTREDFDSLKESFSSEGSPINPQLTSESHFKLYAVSGGHLLETELKLDDLFGLFGSLAGSGESMLEGIKETGENLITIGITFSDIIKRIDVNIKVNFELNSQSEFFSINGKYNVEGNFTITTKSKAPTMPDMETLNAYPEGDISTLFGILGS